MGRGSRGEGDGAPGLVGRVEAMIVAAAMVAGVSGALWTVAVWLADLLGG